MKPSKAITLFIYLKKVFNIAEIISCKIIDVMGALFLGGLGNGALSKVGQHVSNF